MSSSRRNPAALPAASRERRPRRGHRAAAAVLALSAALAPLAAPALAGAGLTIEEALALTFPGCEIESSTVYLTPAQVAAAAALAELEIQSALVRPYRARRDGVLVGTAYFDAHLVRTLPQTLMVVVDTEGRVRRLEVLVFREPAEYQPRAGWYGQFVGRALDAELRLDRGIRSIAGATLSARSTTSAVRRVLALHKVLGAVPP